MSRPRSRSRRNLVPKKELSSMPIRRAGLFILSFLAVSAFMLPTASAVAAPSSWWQVLTGSRPTNLWVPDDNVQEINVQPNGGLGSAIRVEVNGTTVGCLGNGLLASFACPGTGFPASETAAQVEAMLEAAFGTGAVEVTGGPTGVAPFVVTTPKQAAPAIIVEPVAKEGPFNTGEAQAQVLSAGGSGRLVVTITNLGDIPVDATAVPVTVVDELPVGFKAEVVQGFATARQKAIDCNIEAADEVVCSFQGTLRPFEAIEIEISGSLTGEPPEAGDVTVSGGKTESASVDQPIVVSPEETPFGIERFSMKPEEEGGAEASAAGTHPFQLTTTIQLNAGKVIPGSFKINGTDRTVDIVEQPALPRNFRFSLPAGLVGNASKMPECKMADFLSSSEGNININQCTPDTAVGIASATVNENNTKDPILGFARLTLPVFNLTPRSGEPARFGFTAVGDPIIIDTTVDPDDNYKITASVENTTQLAALLSSTVSLWGVPGDPKHDSYRGSACTFVFADLGPCQRPAGITEDAFLRQPVSCVTPLDFGVELEPWNVPLGSVIANASYSGSTQNSCNQVPFNPNTTGSPTSKLASNPTGFEYELTMPNDGWVGPKSTAEGQAKKAEVILPKGMTINPSQGAGLAACSPADYAREAVDSQPGAGCPNASKIGEVQVRTPLLKEEVRGSVYVASPYDNPFGSLLALYMVARLPERGVLIKQAGKVTTDPVTGQIVSTFDNLPQVPVDSFKLRLREGGRSPLSTPPACGTYQIISNFTPWSAADPDNPSPGEVVTRISEFEVERGVNGGDCPAGGVPPFKPDLFAGTLSNSAGTYSPFNLRLTRNDGEQEFTNFSIKLPPGVTGKLAGIDRCSDAAIAAAKARTGASGGLEEIEHPSCPANSQVGRTLVGAGVGGSLTYVPGKVYLAGPFNGAPLSMVSITPARVGPFDLGTVVLRLALKINPETAEVFVDPTGSDPIPHIIQGIPVHARDIRAYVDRPEFVLNPTSCERTSTASTVLGSGLDFGSAADDEPVTVTSPFQAADCASLGFKPKLSLQLLGGTKRGDTPRFKAILQPRKGDANTGRAQVTLPRSAFLEQGHIRTVCTRVQFKAGGGNGEQCPKGSVYGKARAITPLLDDPAVGKVYLRSSDHELPDIVAALRSGGIAFNVVGRIDSLNGRIRNTFESTPDVPVTKFTLELQGGNKGLIVNSTNICKGKHRALAAFKGQNGKRHEFKPVVKAKCGGKKSKSRVR